MSASGYQVRLPNAGCVLKIGASSYWHKDFQSLLRELNRAKSVGEAVFPELAVGEGGATVAYAVSDESGREILRRSRSLRTAVIPRRCLLKLQTAIDQLHAWAEDSRVPQELREFCREFRLPNPKEDPEAYRLTGGMFSRQLHVLWGYEKPGTEAVLPRSKISEKWEDVAKRKDVVEMCKRGFLRRVFRPRNVVFALVLAAAVYMGGFFPVCCAVHCDLIGKGVYNLWRAEERCPRRCALPGCNRHLDANGKCNGHKCPTCGRQMPTSLEQNGKCDDCFWEIK